ncbi:MAG: hypothetical protein KDB33_01880, partial [Acidimicrobiales bacterium]|nr:hypothetical protein [Acidimicrobiales bacterium]
MYVLRTSVYGAVWGPRSGRAGGRCRPARRLGGQRRGGGGRLVPMGDDELRRWWAGSGIDVADVDPA